MSVPYVVGLTGNIATGKSTVLAYLAGKGAHIIDADKLAHVAMAPGGPAFAPIVAAFGIEILGVSGEIDRPALGRIVFANPTALSQLESLVHPQVLALARAEIEKSQAQIVILEAIKLLDGGATLTLCDESWVVTAPMDQQLRRLAESRGMSADDAQRRLAAQSSQEEKMARADVVIDNSGSLVHLYTLLDYQWGEALGRAQQKSAASESA